MPYWSDRACSCKAPGRTTSGVREGFLPSWRGSAELNLKEKLESSQVEKRGRGVLGRRWHTKAKKRECGVCNPTEKPQLAQNEALRVKWEEAKVISKGQAARRPGRRC